MTLTDLFDLSFAGRRDQVGLEFQGRTFTFGELDARGNRMAQALAARGFAFPVVSPSNPASSVVCVSTSDRAVPYLAAISAALSTHPRSGSVGTTRSTSHSSHSGRIR